MKLALLLLSCGILLYGEDAPVMSYEEAGRTWGNITARGVLPSDVQYVRDRIGYYEVVLSYFRDGPGMFNVAPNAEEAALDRIYFFAVSDLGYEALEYELLLLKVTLDSGIKDRIGVAEKHLREQFHARLIRGSRLVIDKLNDENATDGQRDYFSKGLALVLKRVTEHRDWRKSSLNNFHVFPGAKKGQDTIFDNGITKIEKYLADRNTVAPVGTDTTPGKAP